MKKPEKKKLQKFNPNKWGNEGIRIENELDEIYNQACDQWEKYHKEEIDKLKKKANLMEQYQFDSRIEADGRRWAEKKIEELEKRNNVLRDEAIRNFDKAEKLEEYNRSKEKYIETLQKHYNEIYTENTKLLSKIKVMNEIIEDLTLGAEAFKRQKEDEIKDLKEEGEKDYKDLRRFQDKYIKADQELRVLKKKVESLEGEINYLYEQGDL